MPPQLEHEKEEAPETVADVEEAEPKKGEPPKLERENTSTQENEGADEEEDNGGR